MTRDQNPPKGNRIHFLDNLRTVLIFAVILYHAGGVYDREKEFWQNAEMLIALPQACLLLDIKKYWPVYMNVHRFVFDKFINHEVGEWWPLLTRQGEPIWRHMSHNWKINYHTVRSMIETIKRQKILLRRM